MRNIFIMLLIFISSGFSQEIFKVKAIKTLVIPSESGAVFMNPKWAPDGQKIALTSANYRGIWIYELQTGQLDQITDEISAGFGFSWSSNSQYILARVSRFDNNRGMSAVKVFNLTQNEDFYLTNYRQRMPDVPKWTPGNDRVIFYNGNQMEYIDTSFDKVTNESQFICYAISDKIFLENTITGEKTEFQPFPGAIYMNLSLAPDDHHVAFEVYGGNCFVLNLETTGVTDLGPGNYPMWSPDGKYVVYMITHDDGYRYTASDIFISDIEGTFFQNLTSEIDQIAMYPCWSPVENKIAYSTYNLGTIEVIEFEQ